MQATIPSTPILRASFLYDAVATIALGLVLVTSTTTAAALLALPEPLLRGVGLVILPYAAVLVWLGTRAHLPRWVVQAVLAVNVLWVADSVLLLTLGFVSPNALGIAFVLGIAALVVVFAAMQVAALHRAPRRVTA